MAMFAIKIISNIDFASEKNIFDQNRKEYKLIIVPTTLNSKTLINLSKESLNSDGLQFFQYQ